MDLRLTSMWVVFFITVVYEGKGQISSPIETEKNCFNGILKTNCSQSTGRAFVNKLNVGVKNISQYSDTNSSLCPFVWKPTVLPECCVEGIGDCYGEYQANAGDPYVFHKDCVGKNKCTHRPATRMDTAHLNCDDPDMHPAQTSYFDVEFYCIDVNTIGELTNAEKQNDGQGSLLYVWSGTTNSYPVLPAATYTCSVETDCNDTISVISLDFRFSEDDQNLTCIDENKITITDDSISQNFDCSTSNNKFEMKTLYTSTSNYITLQYNGTTAGGYLWLGFQSLSNGSLTLNCKLPGASNVCNATTEEPTTTSEEVNTTTEHLQSTTLPIEGIIGIVLSIIIIAIALLVMGYCIHKKCLQQKNPTEDDEDFTMQSQEIKYIIQTSKQSEERNLAKQQRANPNDTNRSSRTGLNNMNDANPQEKRITTSWNEKETFPFSKMGMGIQLPSIAPSMTNDPSNNQNKKRKKKKHKNKHKNEFDENVDENTDDKQKKKETKLNLNQVDCTDDEMFEDTAAPSVSPESHVLLSTPQNAQSHKKKKKKRDRHETETDEESKERKKKKKKKKKRMHENESEIE